MEVNLSFVPPGGGENDYSLPIDMPEIPRAGDYISILRPGQKGTESFLVKRTWWQLSFDDTTKKGSTQEIWVECEFALGPYNSDDHKNACERYKQKTGTVYEFENSMY